MNAGTRPGRYAEHARRTIGPVAVALLLAVGCGPAEPPSTSDTGTSNLHANFEPQDRDYRIVFSSERDGNSEIYLMNQDGSGLTRLTDNPASDALPYCSPDGSRIVFSSDREERKQLYLMDVDGSDVTRLTHNDYDNNSPSWSPNGSKIAFSSGGNATPSNLFTIQPDGSNELQVTNIAGYNFLSPTWSPDGTKLAAEGGQLGETITTEWGEAGRLQIWTFNADGSDPTQLTQLDAYNGYPAWSPTGSSIVFDSTLEGWADILSVSLADQNVTNLSRDPRSNEFAAWSPDGAKIAFVADRDGNNEIYVMDADGGNQIRLTSHEAAESGPAWCSP